jgi:hypothetical protein
MPLQIDRLSVTTVDVQQEVVAPNFVRRVVMKEVDNKATYSSSTVSSTFDQIGNMRTPISELNMYNLKTMMSVNEVNQDNYFLVAGTVQCDTTPTIGKVSGSFNNVTAAPLPISNTYSYGSVVDNTSGNTSSIEGAEVFLYQTGDRDYAVVAAMFTPENENFVADVTLDVEIVAESPVTFSNETVILPS